MPTGRFSPPPPAGSKSAKAKGPTPPEDAEDLLATTEPDDDLASFIVQPDPTPDPAEELVAKQDSGPEKPAAAAEPPVEAPPTNEPVAAPTTAETELVLRLRRELAEAEARVAGHIHDPATWPSVEAPPKFEDGKKVLIHIREDGFTANGRVWYKGQELQYTVGAENWKATLDRDGNSWLALDDAGQIRRWGQVKFGHGPWPGAAWENERAAAAEARRNREVPGITRLADRLEHAGLPQK